MIGGWDHAEERDLAEMQRLARNTDPDTSHEAAEHMVQSGKAATQRAQVLAIVRDLPDKTAGEIARQMGPGSAHKPSRRLADLRRLGLVHVSGVRKCTITGRRCSTWAVGQGTPSERGNIGTPAPVRREQAEYWKRRALAAEKLLAELDPQPTLPGVS